jgi:hypothetical protein
MSGRTGPFWDAAQGRAPLPRAAQTLGAEFIQADVDAGTIELAFEGTEDFTNPTGNVLYRPERRPSRGLTITRLNGLRSCRPGVLTFG